MSTARSEQADGGGSATDECILLPEIEGIEFVNYVNEEQLDDVMRLVGQDLSEPYSSELCGGFFPRQTHLISSLTSSMQPPS